ncbi:MAG: hypothetical protein K6F17_01590 [Lachnospiraceae bacterium]|nr:hypothetical protein [Lachnospiraceae bacterium]
MYIGEAEFYYYYKSDGILAWVDNKINSSKELRDNTNEKINQIREKAKILNIKLSDEMISKVK